MKKVFILFAVLAFAVSCQVEQQIVVEEPEAVQDEENLVYKTFTVSMPDSDTKTYLDTDGLTVKWSAGDEINVIEAGTGINRTFTLKSGENTNNAVFEGTVTDGQTSFFAVYPNVPATYSSGEDKITITNTLGTTQNAVAGGFDSNYAVMTAMSDAYGNFAFRHGVAYFKIQISAADIKSINLKTASTRFGGAPTFTASTGEFDSINKAKDNITLSAGAGTFTVDEYFYIPVPVKNSTVSTLTLTFENSIGTKCIKTSESLSSKKLVLGKIYNLGRPSVSFDPEIAASNISIEADATAGTINFTVSRLVDGGYVVKNVKSDGLTNSSWGAVSFDSTTGEGSLSFTCDPNTDPDNPKTAIVRLFYTTDGSTELDFIDVTVTQKKAGTVVNTYWLYYGESTTLTNTSNYFTLYNVDLSSIFSGSYGGATSFNVESTDCTYGLYLDAGSDFIQFAVHTGFTAEVTYYYIATVEGDAKGTRTKLTNGSDTQTTSNIAELWGNYASDSRTGLAAGTTWKIQRDNKKPAILLVKVVETSE